MKIFGRTRGSHQDLWWSCSIKVRPSHRCDTVEVSINLCLSKVTYHLTPISLSLSPIYTQSLLLVMTSQIQRSIPSPFSPVRLWTENSKSDLIGTAIAAPWPFCWLTSKDVSPFHLTHLLWIERAIGYCASRDAAAARAPYRGRRPRRARASDTTMFVFHRGLAQVILKYQNMFIFITI